eukprot:994846-Amorphochlora_amoeboformis.AAC.1
MESPGRSVGDSPEISDECDTSRICPAHVPFRRGDNVVAVCVHGMPGVKECEGSDNVLTETPETRDAVELKIKEIIVDVSTQIDSDNPFESKATRAKVLDQSIQATGINIPSVDLASIRSQEDLVEYIWARLGSSEESQETNDRGDLTEEIDLPENLKLS